jgi:hypothetical protein
MVDYVGALKRRCHSRNPLVDLAENPRYPRHERQYGYPGILASRTSLYSISLRSCVEQLHSAFKHLAGLDDAPHEHENHRPSSYPIEQCRPVTASFGRLR